MKYKATMTAFNTQNC